MDDDDLERLADETKVGWLHDEGVDGLRTRVRELEHLARLAGDFRDQIHPDVNWDGVPPWTMAVVGRLDRALAAFDESDK